MGTAGTKMGTDEVRKQLIDLSSEVRVLAHKCLDAITGILQTQLDTETHIALRVRVLLALAVKMLRSYEAMLIDASDERPECMHHLKTLVESYIYFCWVLKDDQNSRANFILAESANQKTKYFNSNDGYSPDLLTAWKDEFEFRKAEFELGGSEFGRKQLEKIVNEANLEKRFYGLYRLCCEVPHLGDVMEYMPTLSSRIEFYKPEISGLWPIIALENGSYLIIQLIKTGIEAYNLNHEEELKNLGIRILEFFDRSRG